MSIVINNRPIGATEMVENPEINIETASFTAVDYNEATKVLTVDPDEAHSFVDGNLYKFVVDVNEFEIDVATKIHFTSPDETIEDVYGHYNSVEDAYVFYGMYDDQNNIEMRESVDRVVRLLAPSEIIAGNGLTKSGNTLAVDPTIYRTASAQDEIDNGKLDKYSTPDVNYQKLYGVAFDGSQEMYKLTNYLAGFTIVYRDGAGRFRAGDPLDNTDVANKRFVDNTTQSKLYVHEGTVSIDGTDYRYKIVNKKSTAFTNPQTDFPERGNLFTLRTGPRLIFNLWYDDSDGTYYWSNINNSGSENSAYTVTILTDYVYAL